MQRRASSRQGATIAPVGQAGMHAWQLPQWAPARSSTGSGRSVRISPRKNHEPRSRFFLGEILTDLPLPVDERDRKSTRLNSSHGSISYAVLCLKEYKYL